MTNKNSKRVRNYCILLLSIIFTFFVGIYCKKKSMQHYANTEQIKVYKSTIDTQNEEIQKLKDVVSDMEIKNNRLEILSQTSSETRVVFKTNIVHDTIIKVNVEKVTDTIYVQRFLWQDAWTSVEGMIQDDSVHCDIVVSDTIYSAIERIPRRFLGIPFGTKKLNQHIRNCNPHTILHIEEYTTK